MQQYLEDRRTWTNEAVHMWIQDAVGLHDGEEEKTQMVWLHLKILWYGRKAILEREEQEASQKKR